jgi:hypothetical protein
MSRHEGVTAAGGVPQRITVGAAVARVDAQPVTHPGANPPLSHSYPQGGRTSVPSTRREQAG